MRRIIAVALCCLAVVLCLGSTTPARAQGIEYKQDYKMDDYDAQIKVIQEQLAVLGYLTGTADGWFGKGTKAAIERFQGMNELEVTGVADRVFQVALFRPDAKNVPLTLMTLDELKELMGSPNTLVKYDMSQLDVKDGKASMMLNKDTALDVSLLNNDVTEIQLIGQGSIKIPFTVVLMKLDNSIDHTTMYTALDDMMRIGDRYIDKKHISYKRDEDGTERLIISPYVSVQ